MVLDQRASSGVHIREVPGGGVCLAGATEREVGSQEEMAQVLADGTMLRQTASTGMNKHSSRSHAIFTITLEQRREVGGALPCFCHLQCAFFPRANTAATACLQGHDQAQQPVPSHLHHHPRAAAGGGGLCHALVSSDSLLQGCPIPCLNPVELQQPVFMGMNKHSSRFHAIFTILGQ